MMDAIVRQFRRPTGLLGRLAGHAMATRPSNRRRNEWMVELLKLAPTDRVFELGCGPGYALELASRAVPRGQVIAVDHSEVMADMARRRLDQAIREGRTVIDVGDEQALGALSSELDAVMSANVVQFLSEPERYFQLALAALKPGGRLATTYQPRGANPSREQAERLAARCAQQMEAAGFSDVRVEWLELAPVPAACILGVKP